MRAAGNDRKADMFETYDVQPGHGIEFDALARVLAIVMVLYVCASLLLWLQGYLVED